MQRLGMPVSDDTMLRQLKRDAAGAQLNSEIRVVGIDGWSWRRATSYGTIMVGPERRSLIDVLDDRSVESVAKSSFDRDRQPGPVRPCMRRQPVMVHHRPSRSRIALT